MEKTTKSPMRFVLTICLFQLTLIKCDVIRITRLIVPEVVQSGESFWLNCTFEQDRNRLYSLKWYKDGTEFYRYIRDDYPSITSFDLPGVHVQKEKSSLGDIYLTGSDLRTSGQYRCEISADAPTFQTVRAEQRLQIYVLPLYGEEVWITGVKAFYSLFDLLNLTCKSGASYPRAQLKFQLNIQPNYESSSWPIDSTQEQAQALKSFSMTSQDTFNMINKEKIPDWYPLDVPQAETNSLILRDHVTEQMVRQGQVTIKCEAQISHTITRQSEVLLISDRSNQRLKVVLTGDGTRITGLNNGGYLMDDQLHLICHSHSFGKTKPTSVRWLLNGQEADEDMLEPSVSSLFEHELSLGLRLQLSSNFIQLWSNQKEKLRGRKSLALRCEAIYKHDLLQSEKTVHLNMRNTYETALFAHNMADSANPSFLQISSKKTVVLTVFLLGLSLNFLKLFFS